MLHATMPVKDCFCGYNGEITRELVDSMIGEQVTVGSDDFSDVIGTITGVHWDKQEVYIDFPEFFLTFHPHELKEVK